MQEASAEVGRPRTPGPRRRPRPSTRRVTTPAPEQHRRHRRGEARQRARARRAPTVELLGVDDRRERRQRDRAARVAGAAAARDDGEPSSMQARTSRRTSSSVSGVSTTNGYSTRQSVASVTCETRAKPSKQMLSRARVPREQPRSALSRSPGRSKSRRSARTARRAGSSRRATLGVRTASSALAAPSISRSRWRSAATSAARRRGLSSRSSCEVGVAPHDPDVAQHLVEHARRAAGAALAAQFVEERPGLVAEQADHDLAIGERGVVVGDLADPVGVVVRRHLGGGRQGTWSKGMAFIGRWTWKTGVRARGSRHCPIVGLAPLSRRGTRPCGGCRRSTACSSRAAAAEPGLAPYWSCPAGAADEFEGAGDLERAVQGRLEVQRPVARFQRLRCPWGRFAGARVAGGDMAAVALGLVRCEAPQRHSVARIPVGSPLSVSCRSTPVARSRAPARC